MKTSKFKRELNNVLVILRKNNTTLFTLFILGLFSEIVFVSSNSDLHTFGIIVFYLALIFLYKVTSKITYLLCLFLLGLVFFAYLFSGASQVAEKSAVFLVLFWIIGIIQQWIE